MDGGEGHPHECEARVEPAYRESLHRLHAAHLSDVDGFNSTRYNPVQGFVRLDSIDEDAMLEYLILTNGKLVLDVVSNAERPESG